MAAPLPPPMTHSTSPLLLLLPCRFLCSSSSSSCCTSALVDCCMFNRAFSAIALHPPLSSTPPLSAVSPLSSLLLSSAIATILAILYPLPPAIIDTTAVRHHQRHCQPTLSTPLITSTVAHPLSLSTPLLSAISVHHPPS
jgi:hypothetical protein